MCSLRNVAGNGVGVVGEWLFYLDEKLIHRENNLVVQTGLSYLAGLLIAETTNNVSMHLALGTGTAVPILADNRLATEGARKAVSAKTRQANTVRLRTFFLPTEVNQTWREFGIFLAGTDVSNSGILLNRIAPTGGISKTSNQTLTIETRIIFAAG